MLFPFPRRIVSDVVRDGGMPPLMIEPIDFVALYRAQAGAMRSRAAACRTSGNRSERNRVPERDPCPAPWRRRRHAPRLPPAVSRDGSGAGRCARRAAVFRSSAAAISIGRQHQLRAAARRPVPDRSARSVRHPAARHAWCAPTGRWRSACTVRPANSARPGILRLAISIVSMARASGMGVRPTRCSSALMNFMSKLALWMTSGASPRNSRNSSTTWANSGLSARNSSVRPCTRWDSIGTVAFGVQIELLACGRSGNDPSARRSRSRRCGGHRPARTRSFRYRRRSHAFDCCFPRPRGDRATRSRSFSPVRGRDPSPCRSSPR